MVDLVSPSPMSSTEGDLNKDVVKAALGRTSIVITTHYIEEARQAGKAVREESGGAEWGGSGDGSPTPGRIRRLRRARRYRATIATGWT